MSHSLRPPEPWPRSDANGQHSPSAANGSNWKPPLAPVSLRRQERHSVLAVSQGPKRSRQAKRQTVVMVVLALAMLALLMALIVAVMSTEPQRY
jgi:hypothetical protein